MGTFPQGLNACVDAVRSAAGELSDEEVQQVFEGLRARTRELHALNEAMDMETAALKAADELARQAEQAAIIERRNALINVRRRAEIVNFVRDNFADRPDLGMESLLVGTNLARRGARLSVDAEQKALVDRYLGGLLNDLDQDNLTAFLASGGSDAEIVDAMWRIGKELDTSDINPSSVKVAQIIHRYQELARIDANRAGASIGKLDGYITRQSHDADKIRRAGFEQWMNDILPLLDASTFRNVSDRQGFLENVYNGIVSGNHVRVGQGVKDSGFKGPANLANKMSQERVLHFRDGLSWHGYNQKYGTGNLREAVIRGLDMAGQNTATLRRLGTNPEANLNMAMDQIAEDLRDDPLKLRAFDTARRNMIANRIKEITGQTRISGNAAFARTSANLRAWQSMSKLGGALLSSATDIPVSAAELRYQGQSYLGSLGKLIAGLTKGRGSLEQRQILSSFGVYADTMRGEIARRFSADDTMGGRMSRAMNHFFRLNGLSWWTDANKASVGLMMSHYLAQSAGRQWKGVDANLKRALSLYDIGETEWELLRQMPMRHADERDYMTPDGVEDIPREAMEGYVTSRGLNVSDASVADAREQLRRALSTYVNDRVTYAVLEPDARTRSIMNQGTQRGTVPGELLRFLSQFKTFPVTYMQKTLGRELYGRGYTPAGLDSRFRAGRDLINALRNGNGEMLGLAQLMVWTTAFGYLSMVAKDAAKGRSPRDPNDYRTWMAAMVQGGGLGIYGDFLFGEVNRFGGGVMGTAVGPMAGTVSDAITLAQEFRSGEADAGSALRLVQNNTPFMNLFYTRIAMDYLFFYSLQEAISPGSLRRTESRIERENDQTFLLKPSENYADPLGIAR
ncbi:hypothetical protein DFO67_1048 [Modicisalibacter xianhensis]|uniref:Uncharacterized protein n=1 Tax=Modicisalibacter xianhensis TaxID=442341 RepID=A0A4R8G2S1_9GAMM|nr:hypothetical protein [Halomonas xianhensis]TDX30753.1 hypothetical protein DFO67_1048 [Halomonas xianhensis]